MKIVIASGKGGTGKTTVALNLAYSIANQGELVRLLDCDVEAPNDHLFLKRKDFEIKKVTLGKPQWIKDNCLRCGKCVEICHYKALAKVKEKILVFDELCHSCGACFHFCPSKSLIEKTKEIGTIRIAKEGRPFSFVDGNLVVGESSAPKVIEAVKDEALDTGINIIDASPGTACPVVKSFIGADLVLLVTEPTPFGKHDLELAIDLAAEMKLPAAVVINRSYGEDFLIEELCKEKSIPIFAKIPFKRVYAETYSRGDILIEHHPELSEVFRMLSEAIFSKVALIPKTRIEKLVSLPINNETFFEKNPLQNVSKKELVVISGKGGTGKTTVSGALADLLDDVVISDCDVDASNLHLLFQPKRITSESFIGGSKCRIDLSKCTSCGLCYHLCRFAAIKSIGSSYQIDSLSCEGCGLCFEACPENAIINQPEETGTVHLSLIKGDVPFIDAHLKVGADNSGKLVSLVREKSKTTINQISKNLILNDGPPGISCPVISSLVGVDFALIVTEPSLSGIHDMERVLKLAEHFKVKAYLIINKADINPERTKWIQFLAQTHHVKVLGEIPFDENINQALINGKTIVKHGQGPALAAIQGIVKELKIIIGGSHV